MTGIFISYRRDDTGPDASRLFADLDERSEIADHIFMDQEAIPPGAPFPKVLSEKLEICEVLLALIGPKWLDTKNEDTGRRRLDEEDDWVRLEIAAALSRGKKVIPVLLSGARMPKPKDLPAEIRDLNPAQAIDMNWNLGSRYWKLRVDELIEHLPGVWKPAAGEAPKPTWRSWVQVSGIAVSLLTLSHVIAVYTLPFDPQLLLLGAALCLGIYADRFHFEMSDQMILGLIISLATGILTSFVIAILSDQPIITGETGEVRRSVIFVAVLFVGYVTGTLLAPWLPFRGKLAYSSHRGP